MSSETITSSSAKKIFLSSALCPFIDTSTSLCHKNVLPSLLQPITADFPIRFLTTSRSHAYLWWIIYLSECPDPTKDFVCMVDWRSEDSISKEKGNVNLLLVMNWLPSKNVSADITSLRIPLSCLAVHPAAAAMPVPLPPSPRHPSIQLFSVYAKKLEHVGDVSIRMRNRGIRVTVTH